MAVENLLDEIDGEVQTLLSSGFKVDMVETEYVPNFDDSYLTFENLDDKTKRCKLLESCVLHIDIRNSAKISVEKQPQTLARLYSAFVSGMIRAARHFHGHVRAIVGDRVMVVYDKQDCFSNAVNTAILMNSISRFIIAKHSKGFSFRCGIGIDYGRMLITKAGIPRRGEETEFYRSLVWLGRPANVASRLTDVANKSQWHSVQGVQEGYLNSITNQLFWVPKTYDEFISNLEPTYSQTLRHKIHHFSTFYKTTLGNSIQYPPILMTNEVYKGYKRANPRLLRSLDTLRGSWSEQKPPIAEYTGLVYGGDVVFADAVRLGPGLRGSSPLPKMSR